MKIPESKFYAYLSALLEGNRDECFLIAKSLIDENYSVIDVYSDLFQKSLYRVGELWDLGKISVAEEHLVTQITEEILSKINPYFKKNEKKGLSVIVSSVAKEFHQIGARMVSDIFEVNGWTSFFLGSNTPINDLLKIIELKKPNAVALSLTFYINIIRLIETIRQINQNFPELTLFIGGQAFTQGGYDLISKFNNVIYIPSIKELDLLLKDFEKKELFNTKIVQDKK